MRTLLVSRTCRECARFNTWIQFSTWACHINGQIPHKRAQDISGRHRQRHRPLWCFVIKANTNPSSFELSSFFHFSAGHILARQPDKYTLIHTHTYQMCVLLNKLRTNYFTPSFLSRGMRAELPLHKQKESRKSLSVYRELMLHSKKNHFSLLNVYIYWV